MTLTITATGFKTAPKGKVANTPEKAAIEFGKLTKSEARKVRKELAAAGKVQLAAVRRAA